MNAHEVKPRQNVKHKDNENGKGWRGALKDAEKALTKAHREVMDWKAVVRICRSKVEARAPWPEGD